MIIITWQEVAKFLLVFGLAWGVLLLLIHLDERADRRANRRIDDRLGALDEWDRPEGVWPNRPPQPKHLGGEDPWMP